jgi:hypothetical protein
MNDQPKEKQSITVNFEIGCITGSIDFTIEPPLNGTKLDGLIDEIKEEIEENDIEITKIVTQKDSSLTTAQQYLKDLGVNP